MPDLSNGDKRTDDLEDPSQLPRKHRVIHWNPEDEEGQSKASSGLKSYVPAIAGGLAIVVMLAGAYFLFFYDAGRGDNRSGDGSGSSVQTSDPRRAFESVSYARGKQDSIMRKLDAARQMPTGGHDVLRQMLINIEKEMIDADALMNRSAYARAVEQYDRVDRMIEEFTTEVESKQQAQNLYDNFIVDSSRLDRGQHLNKQDYESAFILASEGNAFLQQGSFSPALQKLKQATEKLRAVDNSIKEFIRSNAALGHRYIAQGKKDEAIASFTNVLELDPENEDALKHLNRARVADQVFAALQSAEEFENADQLEDALAKFEVAASIDGASAKAQSGVSRVRRKIEERDFNHHFNEAKLAEKESRFEDAIANYRAALEVFPNRSELEASIDRARAAKRQNDIVSRITRAYQFEREFEWEQARDLYQELVNMEPDLKEAKEGLLRTGRMIRSILRYETLLDVAKTEAQRAEFQLAIRTFDRAMQSKPEYLALTEEGQRLRQFLQLQNQPVPVQLISDGSTWVSIQGPSQRKPDKIESDTINLLPGKYFIIGRKKGYQDVRFSLQVRAGMPLQPITVVCDQKSDY